MKMRYILAFSAWLGLFRLLQTPGVKTISTFRISILLKFILQSSQMSGDRAVIFRPGLKWCELLAELFDESER